MKNKKGFTLIELLVVIAIIGLLSTLAVVSLSGARSKARDAKRTSDLRAMQSALELYMSENSDTPPAIGASWAATLFTNSTLSPYLPGPIQDPGTTTEYTYCTDASKNYVVAAVLENTPAQSGVATITDYIAAECINTADANAVPTCNATTGFCLGSSGNP